MAMIAGAVVIKDNGDVASATGMAAQIYIQLLVSLAEQNPPVTIPNGPDSAGVKRGLAGTAKAFATAIVGYLQTNATAEVTGAVAGLQKLPAPPIAGALTAATGGATVHLAIA